MVGETVDWAAVPSGQRESTYSLPEYLKVAPFAEMSYKSMKLSNFAHPALDDTPYTGAPLPNIPEYASFGQKIAQELSAVLAGKTDVDTALKNSQAVCEEAAKQGGYKK